MAATLTCDRCHGSTKIDENIGWQKVVVTFGDEVSATLDLDPRCIDILRNAIKPLTKAATARSPKAADVQAELSTPAVDPTAGLV